MTLPFFTIGHSNRSLTEFIELLREAHIELVADIRTVPRSRTNPQFNKDTLRDALAAVGISYEHMAALGGLRGKARGSPADVNDFWTNVSFHNYADYALSAPFHAGLGICWMKGENGVARSCVRKPCGGGAIAVSSLIISSLPERPSSISWGRAGWSPPVSPLAP